MHRGFRLSLLGAVAILAGAWGSSGTAAAASALCTANDVSWCARVSPSSGPIGTRVTFDGRIDPHVSKQDLPNYVANVRAGPGFVFLIRDVFTPRFCEVIGGVHDPHVSITNAGRIQGSFVVGGTTSCNHSSAVAPPLSPGVYGVDLECMACQVDSFTVTAPSGTLPFTGLDSAGPLSLLGLTGLLTGVALTAVSRRRAVA